MYAITELTTRMLALPLSLVLLSNCSSQSIYENLQHDQVRRCEQIPIAQQATCKAQYQTEYDEYKKLREQLEVEARLEEFE